MGWNRQLEHIQKKMLKVFDLRYQIYTSGKSRERPPKTPPHKGISKCKKTSQNPGEFGWFFTHWTPKRLTYPFAWSRVTHGYRSKCGSKSLGIPKKNLHLSNQYKILVPTKILMLFLGVYFQSSRLVGGYFTAFSAARLVNLGPFGSGQHPTTALMLQAMQDSAVSESRQVSGVVSLLIFRLPRLRMRLLDSKLHGNQWGGVRHLNRNLQHFLQEPLHPGRLTWNLKMKCLNPWAEPPAGKKKSFAAVGYFWGGP